MKKEIKENIEKVLMLIAIFIRKNLLIIILSYSLIVCIIALVIQHNQIIEQNRINSVLYIDWVEINANKDEVYQLYEDTLNKCEWTNFDETDVNRDGITDITDLLIVQQHILEKVSK